MALVPKGVSATSSARESAAYRHRAAASVWECIPVRVLACEGAIVSARAFGADDRLHATVCMRAFACVHLRFPPYGASMDGWAHLRQRAMAPHPEAGLSAHKLAHLALDQPVRINQPTAAHATRSSPALLTTRSAALPSPPLPSPLLPLRSVRAMCAAETH